MKTWENPAVQIDALEYTLCHGSQAHSPPFPWREWHLQTAPLTTLAETALWYILVPGFGFDDSVMRHVATGHSFKNLTWGSLYSFFIFCLEKHISVFYFFL